MRVTDDFKEMRSMSTNPNEAQGRRSRTAVVGGHSVVQLTPEAAALLDAPYPWVITTLRANGQPVSNVVWRGPDGDSVTFTAGHDVLWPKRLRRDARVSIAVINTDDILNALTGFGHVLSITPDPDYEFMNELAFAYVGGPYSDTSPTEYPRVKVTVQLERAVPLQEGTPTEPSVR
jgi:hypothetical protein